MSTDSADRLEALCGMGCHRGILAALVSLLRYREQLEDWWGVVIGPPEKRDNVCQALLDAAAALDRTFAPILDDETATFGLTGIGRIPPGRLSSEPRLYSRMLRLGALLGEEMGVRSLEHFSRCLLTIYIERATGRNNHASLAVIIADVCNRPDYAEDAQKQWRFRCKVLIDSPPSVLAGVSTLLQDLTAAFAVGGESPLATQ